MHSLLTKYVSERPLDLVRAPRQHNPRDALALSMEGRARGFWSPAAGVWEPGGGAASGGHSLRAPAARDVPPPRDRAGEDAPSGGCPQAGAARRAGAAAHVDRLPGLPRHDRLGRDGDGRRARQPELQGNHHVPKDSACLASFFDWDQLIL
jgi:hypothetical protein